MSAEYTIWQNIDLDPVHYQDFLQDCYPEITDEYEKIRLIEELNASYLDDERVNLDHIVESGMIIAIADLGLWFGHRSGYRLIQSGNISDCLQDLNCDLIRWYVDKNGDLRCCAHHHDGVNHYLYREIKPSVSDTQIDHFTSKILDDTFTQRDVTRYTRKLGAYISSIYGR